MERIGVREETKTAAWPVGPPPTPSPCPASNCHPSPTPTTSTPIASDQLSGFSIDAVRLRPYSYSLCKMPLSYADGPSAPTDPSPLVPDYLWDLKQRGAEGDCDAAILNLANPRGSVYWRNPLVGNIT